MHGRRGVWWRLVRATSTRHGSPGSAGSGHGFGDRAAVRADPSGRSSDHRHTPHDGGMPNPHHKAGDQMNKFKLMGWLTVGGLLGAALLAPSAALATQPAPDHKSHDLPSHGQQYQPVQRGDGRHRVLGPPPGRARHRARGSDLEPVAQEPEDRVGRHHPALHLWRLLVRRPELDRRGPDAPPGGLRGRDQRARRRTSRPASRPARSRPASRRRTSRPASPPRTSRPRSRRRTSRPASPPRTSRPPPRALTASRPATASRRPPRALDCVPSTHSVPSGSVDGATGTPDEGVTPPATDTLTPSNTTPSNDGWQLVLIALAALISTALILTPATRKARR